jgi:hypothetical protein
MGNPVPTLKIILILMIVVDSFWLAERLLGLMSTSLFDWMPSALISVIGIFSSVLIILFNILLVALLSRLQLKPE